MWDAEHGISSMLGPGSGGMATLQSALLADGLRANLISLKARVFNVRRRR
jgi:hypothetical protein